MTVFQTRIATAKLQQTVMDSIESGKFLRGYLIRRDRAADFEHRDALAVCKDSSDKLKAAGKAYLDAGGTRNSSEFTIAAKVSRGLKDLGRQIRNEGTAEIIPYPEMTNWGGEEKEIKLAA